MQRVVMIIVFFCFTFLSCAMGTKEEKLPAVVSNDKSNSQKIVLAEIITNTYTYNDVMVKVEGVFKGWKGKCVTSFSITRSDWILVGGPDCIFVSGILPPGLSTVHPGDERIEVTGKIKVAADGKVHLRATAVEVLR
jgi:hypothetical protein